MQPSFIVSKELMPFCSKSKSIVFVIFCLLELCWEFIFHIRPEDSLHSWVLQWLQVWLCWPFWCSDWNSASWKENVCKEMMFERCNSEEGEECLVQDVENAELMEKTNEKESDHQLGLSKPSHNMSVGLGRHLSINWSMIKQFILDMEAGFQFGVSPWVIRDGIFGFEKKKDIAYKWQFNQILLLSFTSWSIGIFIVLLQPGHWFSSTVTLWKGWWPDPSCVTNIFALQEIKEKWIWQFFN